MATIVTRAIKGSALTWTEADANFTNLNTAVVTAQTEIDAHEADTAAAHAASAVSCDPTGWVGSSATDVQEALSALDVTDIAISDALIAHVGDSAGAHAASAIANTPAGAISATTVQAAIDELDTEKAPLASPTFTGTVTSPITDVTNYVDFTEVSEPSNPSSGDLRLWAESVNGFGQLHYKNSAGLDYQLGRDNLHTVRNVTGSAITKGSWVYISGSTGTRPNVALARADSASTVPVAGIIVADIADNANGQMMTLGDTDGVDTTAFNDGDVLFLSESVAGAATTTVPTGLNIVQRLGVVVKDHATTGIIAVLIGGEFNPALTQTLSNKTVLGPEASEVVTATNVIAATESGTTFFLNSATEFVSTLPAPAAGLRFTFICTAAPSGASYTVITNSSANIIIGQQQSVAGDAGDFGTADDTISFVDGQAVAGDRVDVISDGTSWFAYAQSKVAAGITFTQASA